jgi:acylphosphatase
VKIHGRVQGVGYRAWVAETAGVIGLDGWVRNCLDGTVEAVFSGAAVDVSDMLARCRHGPPAACVSDVVILAEGEPVNNGFRVLPSW